ncbi:MFS general substrate transporter [Tothia fuscella]|uniref:MFS general substrate transporter n=1 Tax=Tothia fuscella TaxID=1048955 RepID=A0A9P4NLA8_9PEZI|nr:MFS general substrate transporter [Tothia fuscella]
MAKKTYYKGSDMDSLHRANRDSTSSTTQVVGTTNLYEDGNIRYVPMPTPDPKDPLNLPQWRKVAAIASICFFGALALSAETIIGALIPVFALEYAGIDPKILSQIDVGALSPPGVVNLNPLAAIAGLPGPPIWKVTLLASLPLLTNGVSSYFLVPLSISVGRRPVLLACGVLAIFGGFWAGSSRSLESHIAARCVQAVGAGAVEALIPLTVQDMVFIHQRNTAMSAIWSTQGLIIVSLGIGSPVIVANIGWRSLYYITSSIAIIAWLGLLIFLPETRWKRSQEELSGKSVYFLYPGEARPRLDSATYGRRTARSNFGFFQNGYEHKDAGKSMIDTLRTMVFPNIIWVIAINSVFISIQGAAGQTGSSILIASGWKFKTLGLAVVPLVVATPFVWLLGGFLADKVSNMLARRNGGRREPEGHLVNLILPLLFGILGCLLFGYGAQYVKVVHWSVILTGIFFIALGFLTANTVLSVYIVESYPQWAGPVLVNVSSFRCIIGFAMSFRATTLVQQRGFLGSFAIYASTLGALSLLLPVMFLYGKLIRQWSSGTVQMKDTSEKQGSYMEY